MYNPGDHKMMKTDLKETKKLVMQMNEKLSKCTVMNNFVEEEIEMDVKYIKETGLQMILDSGVLL